MLDATVRRMAADDKLLAACRFVKLLHTIVHEFTRTRAPPNTQLAGWLNPLDNVLGTTGANPEPDSSLESLALLGQKEARLVPAAACAVSALSTPPSPAQEAVLLNHTWRWAAFSPVCARPCTRRGRGSCARAAWQDDLAEPLQSSGRLLRPPAASVSVTEDELVTRCVVSPH